MLQLKDTTCCLSKNGKGKIDVKLIDNLLFGKIEWHPHYINYWLKTPKNTLMIKRLKNV